MDNNLSGRVKAIRDELLGLKAKAGYQESGLSNVITTSGSWSGSITPASGQNFRNVCLSVRFTPDKNISYTPIATLGFTANINPSTADLLDPQVFPVASDRGVYDRFSSYVCLNEATSEYVEWYFFFTNPVSYQTSRSMSVQFQVLSMLSGSLTIGVVR